jgi:hypothetical protein
MNTPGSLDFPAYMVPASELVNGANYMTPLCIRYRVVLTYRVFGPSKMFANQIWSPRSEYNGESGLPGGIRGLLDISTARYFYKVYKTVLHKPTANSGVNIFYNKCSYKHYLQLL